MLASTIRLSVTASTLALALAASPAFAGTEEVSSPALAPAETAEAADAASGEITITARRRQETAQQVPLAISVLGGDRINDTGAFNVGKLQQLAPTLQFYSSNPRNTGVNIRGIGVPFGLTNDGFEPGVGIYVDDVYYARPASTVLDFLDVAQIEVLRGPQGTLYGKNTTAGAINITTNQPTFSFEGSAEISAGNLGFRQARAAVSGPLSDTIAARIALSATSRRGTVFNVASGNWINEQDNIGVRGQLLFRPNSNFEITLAGDYSRQDPECCAQIYVGLGRTQRPLARQYEALAALQNYTVVSTNPFDRLTDVDASLNAGNTVGGVSLRVRWDVGPGTLTSITAWRHWDWKPENDRDFTGLPIVTNSQNPSQHDQYTQELRYNHSGRRLDFVAGAFLFNQRVDTQGTERHGPASSRWNINPSDPLSLDPSVLDGLVAFNEQYLKSTSAALFGQVSWRVTDAFTVQPGVRLNYDTKEGLYARTVFDGLGNPVPATGGDARVAAQRGIFAPQFFNLSDSAWNFSYDLTLSYQATPDLLIYATYAKTFKTFGLNQNGVPALAGVPQLQLVVARPESVNHFEAGIKAQFWDRRVTLNLSAFRTTIDDYQANVISTADPGLVRPYIANAERVRTQGVELDFSVRPSERFFAYFNGAYTDARYVTFTAAPPPPELSGGTTLPIDANGNIIGTPSAPGTPGGFSPPFVDISGSVLPGVSKWSFSYGVEANVPAALLGREGQVFFGVEGNYRSRFSSNPTPSQYLWIDGYALTNVRLGFRTDSFSIYGWIRNAFDVSYFEQLATGPGNTGLIVGNLGDPRTWGGTVRFAF